MFSRTMMLALGEEVSKSIGVQVDARKASLLVDASLAMNHIWDEGITSEKLIALSDLGKTLANVEKASKSLTYFNDNFSTGGIDPKGRRLQHKSMPVRLRTVKSPETTE